MEEAKSNSGLATTAMNFRTDVTANGIINSSDISLIKSKSGSGLNAAQSGPPRKTTNSR